MKNQGLGQIIDIYKLRAAFNECADAFDDIEGVKGLLKATKEFENLMTYYYPEYPTLPENKIVIKKASQKLTEIAERAFALEAEALILPVPVGSCHAPLVSDMVLSRFEDLPIKILLPVR